MRVLRIYHAGRDRGHRARERALTAAGVEVVLVVPSSWDDSGAEARLSDEPFRIVELPVLRSGDVNRHRFADPRGLATLVADVAPDLIDLHEEPFSLAARQWLAAAGTRPCVGYTAQNVDKRFPPPFAHYERAALARLSGIYACSRQAASVVRGKGFPGPLEVLPLGVDMAAFSPGQQLADRAVPTLGMVGRLVPEKGVLDAVRVLHALFLDGRSARLLVVGSGPEEARARALARELGLAEHVTFEPWQSAAKTAAAYARMHVVLVPSTPTATWAEQFGRVVPEAQASGAVVAAYASGALPEVVRGSGILVPPGDVDALAGAVGRLLSSPGDLERLRAAGIASSSRCSWEEVARQQMGFYEQVLSHEPVPPSSSRRRRALAREEFGQTARLAGPSARPFALPILRADNRLTRAVGRVLDVGLR